MVKKPLRSRYRRRRSKGGAATSPAHFDASPKGGVKAKSVASARVWRAYDLTFRRQHALSHRRANFRREGDEAMSVATAQTGDDGLAVSVWSYDSLRTGLPLALSVA